MCDTASVISEKTDIQMIHRAPPLKKENMYNKEKTLDYKIHFMKVVYESIYDKGAGYSDSLRKSTEELSGRGTSRHPKVLKIGPNHGFQWIFRLEKSRRHKTTLMAQK